MRSSPGRAPRLVALIGFMGAGKSTVGRLVAAGLKVPFLDIDELVVADAGISIPEILGFSTRWTNSMSRMPSPTATSKR